MVGQGELGIRARDSPIQQEPTFRLEGLDLVGDGVGQACLCRRLFGACAGMVMPWCEMPCVLFIGIHTLRLSCIVYRNSYALVELI